MPNDRVDLDALERRANEALERQATNAHACMVIRLPRTVLVPIAALREAVAALDDIRTTTGGCDLAIHDAIERGEAALASIRAKVRL